MKEELYTEEDVQAVYIAGLLAGMGRPGDISSVDYLSDHLNNHGWKWIRQLLDNRRRQRHKE